MQGKVIKHNFNRFTSVLSEGFTDRDATPPSLPSNLSSFRKIGMCSSAGEIHKKEKQRTVNWY